MKTWKLRGIPALWAFAALCLCLISAITVGCGGSSSPGRSTFLVDGEFEAYTGRAIPGYVGSIRVVIQTGSDTPIELTPINRQTQPVQVQVTAEKDYTFNVTAYHGEQLNGAIVGRLTFTRRSPRRGNTENVIIDNLNTDVASLHVTVPQIIQCGSTVEIMVEARNSSGNPILNCDEDSSLGVTVTPTNAGTIAFNNGNCEFTATDDVSMDGTQIRFSTALGGQTADATATLDCEISKLLMNVHWNADTRGIPGYAQSARITVRHFGVLDPVCDLVLNRTSNSDYIEDVECPEALQDGDYEVTVQAFAGADAGGALLASEVFAVTVDPDEDPITINMNPSGSLIDRVRYTLIRNGNPVPETDPIVLFQGETVDIDVDALNAAGEIVLSGDEIVNTFAGPNVQQVDNNTVKALLVGDESTITSNIGDAPGPFVRNISVILD